MDELVFDVEGATAKAVRRVPLSDLELTERQHLQEWVLAHPEIIGEGVKIVTSEFDRWAAPTRAVSASPVRDRLDVLGVDPDGRLVLAELKRGLAPDTTDVQAIKYAALASRFSIELLGEALSAFRGQLGEDLDADAALMELVDHTGGALTAESVRRPRIVLLAEDFSATLTTSVVWLNEMGMDFTLITYRAYELESGARVVTTSRLLPVPNAEDFVARPRSTASESVERVAYPTVEWTAADLEELRRVAGAALVQALDRMAAQPSRFEAHELAQPEFEARNIWSSFGGLTVSTQKRFGRGNTPVTYEHTAQGWRYSMAPEVAHLWPAVAEGGTSSSDPV